MTLYAVPPDDDAPDPSEQPDSGDIGDTTETVGDVQEASPPAAAAVPAASSGGSVSDALFELVAEQGLFRTRDQEAFVSFEADGHRETRAVESTMFKSWLIRTAHVEFDAKLSAGKVNDLLALIKAHALRGSDVRGVHVRAGGHEGNVYLDLCNAAWEAVEITPAGWSIVGEPPIHFRRDHSALPLPVPVHGGTLEELRGFVNVNDDGWMLICSWMVAALLPRGPYPVLDLVGEQGSAKSTTAKLVRALVDPNKAPLRSEPRNPQDLMISATNARVIALDNLSKIKDQLSDALCRLATGGGFATRRLYTNSEEVVLDAQRPVILTGIGDHATRSDLLDREVLITLNPISEAQRLTEEVFWERFEEARPRILGVLLDVLAHTLATYRDVELPGHPRMADFARCAAAAAPAFGWPAEAFLEAYEQNRRDLNALALDDSPLTPAVRELAAEGFHGTAADLLATLRAHDEDAAKRPAWPKTPRTLSATLNRLAPNFRAEGIEITSGRDTAGTKQRFIDISRSDAGSPEPTGPFQALVQEAKRKKGKTAAARVAPTKQKGTEKQADDPPATAPRPKDRSDAGDAGDAASHSAPATSPGPSDDTENATPPRRAPRSKDDPFAQLRADLGLPPSAKKSKSRASAADGVRAPDSPTADGRPEEKQA